MEEVKVALNAKYFIKNKSLKTATGTVALVSRVSRETNRVVANLMDVLA